MKTIRSGKQKAIGECVAGYPRKKCTQALPAMKSYGGPWRALNPVPTSKTYWVCFMASTIARAMSGSSLER